MPQVLSALGSALRDLREARILAIVLLLMLGAVAMWVTLSRVFCTLWVVTLPLWLTGIAALILPVLRSAYLGQRLFRYDALAERARREE